MDYFKTGFVVVSQHNNQEHYFNSLKAAVEPAFEYADHNDITYKSLCSEIRLVDFQSNLIVANRKNIITHVRKIVLLRESNAAPPKLFAAFIDFFGSLEEKGAAIKRRLLMSCKSKLEDNQFKYLVMALKAGAILRHRLLETVQTLLLFERYQFGEFIKTKEELLVEHLPESDLKQTVSDYLENSQTELAIELLENALSKNPKLIEMGELLMRLYKSTGNKGRFVQLFTRVVAEQRDEIENELPPFWRETSSYFDEVTQ